VALNVAAARGQRIGAPARWSPGFACLAALLLAGFAATLGVTLDLGSRLGELEVGVMVRSAPEAGEAPRVAYVWPWAQPPPELQPGDALLAVGGRDLRGAGALAARAAIGAALRPAGTGRATVRRGGELRELELRPASGGFPWWSPLPFSVVAVACAAAILVWAPGWREARRFFVAGVLLATGFATTPFAVGAGAWTGAASYLVGMPIGLALMCQVAAVFTESARPAHPLQRGLPWGVALLFGGAMGQLVLRPDEASMPFWHGCLNLASILICLLLLAGLTRAYLRSDAGERRQLRSVLYAFYLGLVPYVLAELLWAQGVREAWVMGAARCALVAIPLGILAGVGSRSFDVDRIIGSTLSYTVVLPAAVVAAGLLIPTLAGWISELTGLGPGVTQLAAAVGVAGLALPAQRALHPRIGQAILADQHELEAGIHRLAESLRGAGSLEVLVERACRGVGALLGAESLVCYARIDASFAPLYASGGALPPALPADGPLLAALCALAGPVAAERVSDGGSLEPFERAALETLGAALVVPVRVRAELSAFVALGPRRSGDIYTSTCRALLAALARAISQELARLGDEKLLDEARTLQEGLRRYVPAPVAERIAEGAEVAPGEMPVTVVFVDVRGYTTLAEQRSPEQVFDLLTRHTERVSRIVASHGGHVVDFYGDGLLSVFGAPDPLLGRERAAVEAAREVLVALALAPSGPERLSVGIGIATGPAFVGNIRSADRWVWTVVGDTVNLAARLQALTRELEVALLVDAPTFEAARSACADFELHPEMRIRGRSGRPDLYALRLAPAGPPNPT
jgi:class 3 adenylate cyclase